MVGLILNNVNVWSLKHQWLRLSLDCLESLHQPMSFYHEDHGGFPVEMFPTKPMRSTNQPRLQCWKHQRKPWGAQPCREYMPCILVEALLQAACETESKNVGISGLQFYTCVVIFLLYLGTMSPIVWAVWDLEIHIKWTPGTVDWQSDYTRQIQNTGHTVW